MIVVFDESTVDLEWAMSINKLLKLFGFGELRWKKL